MSYSSKCWPRVRVPFVMPPQNHFRSPALHDETFLALLDLLDRSEYSAREQHLQATKELEAERASSHRLRDELDAERTSSQRLKEELVRLKGSLSWRVTEPLRTARMLIRRVRRAVRGA